jgi:hypothetical protein
MLIIGLVMAQRARDFDVAFALLLCVSWLVNPVAWSHYLAMALLPLAVVLRYLRELNFPADLTLQSLLVGIFCSMPHSVFRNSARCCFSELQTMAVRWCRSPPD